MKKLGLGLRCCHRIVFGALALLPCTGTALATQVEKTVGNLLQAGSSYPKRYRWRLWLSNLQPKWGG